MTERNFGTVRYTALCTQGLQLQAKIDSEVGRRSRVSFLLMDAEEEHPERIARYRDELTQLKEQIQRERGGLMQHVAHCTDGCARDKTNGLSTSVFNNQGAPSHSKPPLPPMVEVARRLREGEALEAISAEYDRSPDTIRQKLGTAGFSGRDGRPTHRPKSPEQAARVLALPSEPWREDALCAQTDPEIFFPEKGGSTREAKSVCASCTVAAECLDSAIANDERFGLWGGLSERDRRKVAKALHPDHLDTQEAS